MSSSKGLVAVVDDEASIRSVLCEYFQDSGYEAQEFGSLGHACSAFENFPPDVAIVDMFLPDGNALDVIPRLRAAEIPVIVLTGNGTIDLAVRAIKEGAENFVTKPVQLEIILNLVERCISAQRNRRKAAATSSRSARHEKNPFLGLSPAIGQLKAEVQKIIGTDYPILIQGETGTGKGVLATWLHQRGPRADEAFVDLNCAGLPRELLETELFGHEKGAFTGAAAAKQGLLNIAHRGTVFLDEIGDMDLTIQPKLLKVLEEKRFRSLGGVRDHLIDVHLIAATNTDLNKAVETGKFRADLFYRINALPLRIPSLRERPEDIPIIATVFLAQLQTNMGRSKLHFSPEAITALKSYHWPGNIRELRNMLERAALLSPDGILRPAHFIFQPASNMRPISSDASGLTLEQVEHKHIQTVLAEEGGSVQRASIRLGIPRSTLYAKLKQYQPRPSSQVS
jgi:DNA-binding NtrC family response regulator